MKKRARYLLSGARLPTQFWGVAALAAAQLERVDAGLGCYPRIPFGTRGMLVTSPAPRNAWAPRAEPCTIFGICDTIHNAHWVYQKGHIKARTDLQPQGLSTYDLCWIKLEVGNWDCPDRPLDLPPIEDYDAGAIPHVHPKDLPAATRESATCVACLQTRRGRRQTKAHSLVWGECLRAPRPIIDDDAIDDKMHEPVFEDIDAEHALPPPVAHEVPDMADGVIVT